MDDRSTRTDSGDPGHAIDRYTAYDPALDRRVALKVLPAIEEHRREATLGTDHRDLVAGLLVIGRCAPHAEAKAALQRARSIVNAGHADPKLTAALARLR